jgi:hypothetical protein
MHLCKSGDVIVEHLELRVVGFAGEEMWTNGHEAR